MHAIKSFIGGINYFRGGPNIYEIFGLGGPNIPLQYSLQWMLKVLMTSS